MRALAERGAQAPLLIFATTRPEFRPPWSLSSHHSVISLSPLDRVQVAKMVGEISARHALSRDIIEGVNERTGGVPLFVEEVTRLLLERGEQGGAQAIPPTLQQSLAARLDRLGAAREIAQIGAVLGRGFSYALLRSVAGLDERALQSSLERLAEADLLFVEGDGAASDLPLQARADPGRGLRQPAQEPPPGAASPRGRNPARQRNGPEPEAIAHHFTEAGLDDLAIEWWGKAGDQALRRSAFQEAIAHLGKAIAMADKAAGALHGRTRVGGSASRQRLTQLHVTYSEALMYCKGSPPRKLREPGRSAAELRANRDDFSERSPVRHGQWTLAILRGELPRRGSMRDFLREAENARPPWRPASPTAASASSAAFRRLSQRARSTANGRSRSSTRPWTSIWRRGSGSDDDPGAVAMSNPCHHELAIGRGRTRERTDRHP